MNRKIKTALGSILVLGFATIFLSGCATEEQKQAKLQSEARIGRGEAEKAALAKVPGGTINAGELEKEKGKLIYSFDIAKPGRKDVTEVQVDARTGEVVSVEQETAEREAKEKK